MTLWNLYLLGGKTNTRYTLVFAELRSLHEMASKLSGQELFTFTSSLLHRQWQVSYSFPQQSWQSATKKKKDIFDPNHWERASFDFILSTLSYYYLLNPCTTLLLPRKNLVQTNFTRDWLKRCLSQAFSKPDPSKTRSQLQLNEQNLMHRYETKCLRCKVHQKANREKKNAQRPTIYFIRHGEKPPKFPNGHDAIGLSPIGETRAQGLVDVFGRNSDYNIGYIYAQRYKPSMPLRYVLDWCQASSLIFGNSWCT